MTSRTLGPEGLTVPALGLGCMGMSQGYGPTDDAESIATVQRAIDLGVSFLDTAMSYGAGHNERLLGRALDGHRDDVVLATKFGIVRDPSGGTRVDARPERVRSDCEASLALLGVEHVDLYYLHRVDRDAERNLALVEELRRLAAEHDATPDQLALACLLAPGQDVVAIPGTKRRERLEENAGAAAIEFSAADLDRLETLAPRRAWSGDRHSFTTRTARTAA